MLGKGVGTFRFTPEFVAVPFCLAGHIILVFTTCVPVTATTVQLRVPGMYVLVGFWELEDEICQRWCVVTKAEYSRLYIFHSFSTSLLLCSLRPMPMGQRSFHKKYEFQIYPPKKTEYASYGPRK